MITILLEVLRQIQYKLLDHSKHALINYFQFNVFHLSVIMALKIVFANMRGGYVYIWKRGDINVKSHCYCEELALSFMSLLFYLPRITDIYEVHVSSLSSNKCFLVYPEWVELYIRKRIRRLNFFFHSK